MALSNAPFEARDRRDLGEPLYPRPSRLDVKKALLDALEILRRGKWLLLFTTLLFLGAVAVYTYKQTPLYQASTLLLMKTSLETSARDDALSYGYIEGPGLDYRALSNEVLTLQQSLPIAERVAERLIAMQTIPETGKPISMLQGWGDSPPVTNLARALQGRIFVQAADEQSRWANAILVSSTGTVPAETALLANLFAEEYVKNTQDQSRQRIIASRTFLEEHIGRRRAELSQLEERIRQYRSQEKAVALDQEAQYAVAQSAQLDADLDEARVTLSMAEASLQSREQELERIQPQLAQRVASGVEKEIEQSQVKIAELELMIEPFYVQDPRLREDPSRDPDVERIHAQITRLKERVGVLSQQYVDETLASGGPGRESGIQYVSNLKRQIAEDRVSISGMHAKIGVLEQRIREYDEKLRAIPTQSLELAQLQRAQQSTEQLYNDLVAKLQEARLAEESEIGFARIIRPAFEPRTPILPNPRRNLILGSLLGFLLGIGVTIVRHKLDTRVRTPDDLQKNGFPILGVIPDMRSSIREDFRGASKVAALNGREISTLLAPLLAPLSPAAEAYRHLYLMLQFSLPNKVIQTILVTSPEAGAGKSVTAINLAITIAQAKRRVLIIDADLRIPVVHDYLGLSHPVGLDALLFSEVPHVELRHLATGIDGVYALAAKKPVDNPVELLRSKRLRDLIDQLQDEFDVIIFDSSPVLAATDALLLATQCDVTVLLASAASTESEALKYAAEQLENVGATIGGAVLNKFDASQVYAYKHTYGYQHAYYKKYRQTVRS